MIHKKTAALNIKSISPLGCCMILIALMTLTTLAGCQNTLNVSDKDIVPLPYPKLKELMDQSKPGELVLLDVRKADKHNAGHIPGSINIFLPDLTASEPQLAKAQHIIVYGSSWGDPLARAACKRLIALGYKGVQEFQGGMDVWKKQGRLIAVNRDEQVPAQTPEQ